MAIRYTITHEDRSYDGRFYRVEIDDPAFASTAAELEPVDPDFLILTTAPRSSDDEWFGVAPTTLELIFHDPDYVVAEWVSDLSDYTVRLRVYRSNAGASTTNIPVYEGYILPDFAVYGLDESQHVTRIAAADGFARLDEVTYDEVFGGGGTTSVLDFIRGCLILIDIDLPLRALFHLYPWASTPLSTPLDDIFIQNALFEEIDETVPTAISLEGLTPNQIRAFVRNIKDERQRLRSAHEPKESPYLNKVLEEVLTVLGCRLFQSDGHWWLQRLRDLEIASLGAVDVTAYSPLDGGIGFTTSMDLRIGSPGTAAMASLYRQRGGQGRQVQDWNQAIVDYVIQSSSFVANPDFTEGVTNDDSTPWQYAGSPDLELVELSNGLTVLGIEAVENSLYEAALPSEALAVVGEADKVFQDDITIAAGQRYRAQSRFRITGSTGIAAGRGLDCWVFRQDKIDIGGTSYYLQADGTWSDTGIEYIAYPVSSPWIDTAAIDTDPIPGSGSGTLSITLLRPYEVWEDGPLLAVLLVQYLKADPIFIDSEGRLQVAAGTIRYTGTAVDAGRYRREPFVVGVGDGPSSTALSALLLSDGTHATGWKQGPYSGGASTTLTLFDHLLSDVLNLRRKNASGRRRSHTQTLRYQGEPVAEFHDVHQVYDAVRDVTRSFAATRLQAHLMLGERHWESPFELAYEDGSVLVTQDLIENASAEGGSLGSSETPPGGDSGGDGGDGGDGGVAEGIFDYGTGYAHPNRIDCSNAIILDSGGTGDATTLEGAHSLISSIRTTIIVRGGSYPSSPTFLSKSGTSSRNLAIVCEDPNNPPVFTFGVTSWPPAAGSWQGINITGDYWYIHGIIVKEARYPFFLNADHVTIDRCTISDTSHDGILLSQDMLGWNQINGCTFDRIGRYTDYASTGVSEAPRHAIYLSTRVRTENYIWENNNARWCGGASYRMKGQQAYEDGFPSGGVYGGIVRNNVGLNCSDNFIFEFLVEDILVENNTHVYIATSAEEDTFQLRFQQMGVTFRACRNITFKDNLWHIEENSDENALIFVGYQVTSSLPGNQENTFTNNYWAHATSCNYGWNQMGSGLSAPDTFNSANFKADSGETGTVVPTSSAPWTEAEIDSFTEIRALPAAYAALNGAGAGPYSTTLVEHCP